MSLKNIATCDYNEKLRLVRIEEEDAYLLACTCTNRNKDMGILALLWNR